MASVALVMAAHTAGHGPAEPTVAHGPADMPVERGRVLDTAVLGRAEPAAAHGLAAAVVADTSVEAAVVMPAVAVVTAAADTGKLF